MYKALIIDDDTTIQAILQRILVNKFDFTIYRAFNGKEGLEVLSQNNPDFIILDISMPIMNRIEFLRIIRKDEKYKSLPVLIISANNDRDAITNTIGLGITDYILKPIDVDVTINKIRKVIDKIITP